MTRALVERQIYAFLDGIDEFGKQASMSVGQTENLKDAALLRIWDEIGRPPIEKVAENPLGGTMDPENLVKPVPMPEPDPKALGASPGPAVKMPEPDPKALGASPGPAVKMPSPFGPTQSGGNLSPGNKVAPGKTPAAKQTAVTDPKKTQKTPVNRAGLVQQFINYAIKNPGQLAMILSMFTAGGIGGGMMGGWKGGIAGALAGGLTGYGLSTIPELRQYAKGKTQKLFGIRSGDEIASGVARHQTFNPVHDDSDLGTLGPDIREWIENKFPEGEIMRHKGALAESMAEFEAANPGQIPFKDVNIEMYNSLREQVGMKTPWTPAQGLSEYLANPPLPGAEATAQAPAAPFVVTEELNTQLKSIIDKMNKPRLGMVPPDALVGIMMPGELKALHPHELATLKQAAAAFRAHTAQHPENVPMPGVKPELWPGAVRLFKIGIEQGLF